ncbi:hypothetical protein PFISCL1PPCAC_14143, partial [Pristionchus fissidentatus]
MIMWIRCLSSGAVTRDVAGSLAVVASLLVLVGRGLSALAGDVSRSAAVVALLSTVSSAISASTSTSVSTARVVSTLRGRALAGEVSDSVALEALGLGSPGSSSSSVSTLALLTLFLALTGEVTSVAAVVASGRGSSSAATASLVLPNVGAVTGEVARLLALEALVSGHCGYLNR